MSCWFSRCLLDETCWKTSGKVGQQRLAAFVRRSRSGRAGSPVTARFPVPLVSNEIKGIAVYIPTLAWRSRADAQCCPCRIFYQLPRRTDQCRVRPCTMLPCPFFLYFSATGAVLPFKCSLLNAPVFAWLAPVIQVPSSCYPGSSELPSWVRCRPFNCITLLTTVLIRTLFLPALP